MFWRLITKMVVDVVTGLIVELVLAAIFATVTHVSKPRRASVA
ncbi:MAG TPA: hypothetical protein VFV38_20365 [Ktedonobacteraceae bacterium]|nr:hypothetical protein [Ktedonobacteraceae bacterium]